ncbi:MAG: isoprenylcysteine carboxylmethyltransferase family protein [Myxococcota bacterium]
MIQAISVTTAAVGTLGVAGLLWSILRPELAIWPLPEGAGPALRTRRALNRALGISSSVLLLAIVGVACATLQPMSGWQRSVGLVLFFGGGLFALAGYFALGTAGSHGAQVPLVASGIYRYSRNPQYLGTLFVLAGAVVASGSAWTAIAAAPMGAWFALAPFAEENWLRSTLGGPFDAYLRQTPRYLGWPRAKRSA